MQRDISREATAWLVQLDDDPHNKALRLQFIDWLAASPAHMAAWEETERVSGLMTTVGPHGRSPNMALVRRVWIPRFAHHRAMSALALVACLAWLVAPDLSLWMRSDEITQIAELRIVRLQDGSTVQLAPATAIAFSNGPKGRTLELLRGEAWFDVARDEARPFRVIAGDSTVTVLGTAFSVRKADHGTEIAVERGRVAVATPDTAPPDRVMLVAGQSVAVSAGVASRGTIRPDRVASWREGVAIVNDQPIGDVIERLRPWYRGFIVARGPGLKSRHVSGIYDLRDPDRALEALARAHQVTVSRVSPWLRIVTIG